MSELNHVFRSDDLPEQDKEEAPETPLVREVAKAVTTVPLEPQSLLKTEPEPEIPAETEAVAVAPEADLDFTVTEENLWHPSEIMQQRMTQLSASSQNTSHQLDAHEAVSQRLEKKLGAL
jgi:hypothetical protein